MNKHCVGAIGTVSDEQENRLRWTGNELRPSKILHWWYDKKKESWKSENFGEIQPVKTDAKNTQVKNLSLNNLLVISYRIKI